MPIAVVEDRASRGRSVLQILRRDGQRLSQRLAVSDVKAGAVKVGHHPLVRVEAIAVDQFEPFVDPAKLRA